MLESDVFKLRSIKHKLQFITYLFIVLIGIISIVNYLNLRSIDKKISFGFIISELFDAALEMRRFEKNFMLYKAEVDHQETLSYTDQMEDIIRKNRAAIMKLSPETNIAQLESALKLYRNLMNEYHQGYSTLEPKDLYALEGRLRLDGKKIIDITEGISKAEKHYIQSLIARAKHIRVGSIVLLGIVGVMIARYLSRMILQPLQELEDGMEQISQGNFIRLTTKSEDQEIISLGNACSRMITEIELRQKKFMMQSERLASLGTMISGVAHELNNPLSNVFSSCQILQEEITEGDMEYKKLLLQQIHDEIERARQMVQTLLDFSRRTEFKRKPYSLKYIVDEALRLIHGELPARVAVSAHIPDSIWIVVNKQRFEQMILNLIKNAVDAIPDEGSVDISAREFRDEGVVKIGICDTGIGIDKNKIAAIFEPFYTTKEDGKGSGLGLFITRQIVEDHEGKIMVESAPGEGTVFTITLPLKEV